MTTGSDDASRELLAALQRLETRLASLEHRIDRLESSAHVPPLPKTISPVSTPVAQAPAPPSSPPPSPAAPSPRTDLPPLVIPEKYRPTRAAAFAAAHPPRPVAADSASIETKIGKTLAAWVGALVVLGGILFFIVWIRPTPVVRVSMAFAAGVALIGIGQWSHARKMQALAASLVGIGVAVLMATFFAANVAFDTPVLSREVAFAGVMAVGVLGIGFSLQMRLMALAILALVGMYLSPLILNSHQDQSLALLVYIAVVTATGLGVSFFKRNWWAVRGVAFALGWLWVLAWAIEYSRSHGVMGIIACGGFFAMYLAETVASLLRVMSAPADEDAPDRPASPNTVLLETGTAVLSFGNTVLAMCVFAIVYYNAGMSGLWMIALGLAGIMGLLMPATPSKFFSIAAGIQAMGLVILAVPLYFDHSAITFAWAILGLALAVYSYVTDSKVARIWMFVMLLLVAVRILIFETFLAGAWTVALKVGNEEFRRWTLMAWGGALYALVLAWLGRLREVAAPDGTTVPRGDLWITAAAVPIGTLLFCIAAVLTLHSDFPLTLAIVAWALLVIGFGYVTVAEKHAAMVEAAALALLMAATVKWVGFDGISVSVMKEGGRGESLMPVVNLFVLSGAIMVVAIVASRMLRSAGWVTRATWIAILAFVAINVEALRVVDGFAERLADPWKVKNMVISVLWGLIGLGGVMVGFGRKIAPVRWVALVLLGATVTKVLLVDMAHIEAVWRVLSFMVVGVVLLLVSFIYHKVGARAKVEPFPK